MSSYPSNQTIKYTETVTRSWFVPESVSAARLRNAINKAVESRIDHGAQNEIVHWKVDSEGITLFHQVDAEKWGHGQAAMEVSELVEAKSQLDAANNTITSQNHTIEDLNRKIGDLAARKVGNGPPAGWSIIAAPVGSIVAGYEYSPEGVKRNECIYQRLIAGPDRSWLSSRGGDQVDTQVILDSDTYTLIRWGWGDVL